jgi:tetratricopeptide (TPR) repeat protein
MLAAFVCQRRVVFDAPDFCLIDFEIAGTFPAAEGIFVRAETRRQLKEDKFSRVTIDVAEATAHWSAENRSKLVVGAVVLLAVAAAAVGLWFYLDRQDQRAGVDLSRALRTLNTDIRPVGTAPQPEIPSFASAKERSTEAHKQFQAIVDQYPHTHAAEVSRYFVGQTSAELGDYAAAEKAFQETATVRNDDLAALGKLALASVYRSQGRYKDAVEIYKKLSEKPTNSVGKPTALLELAATYQLQQQPLEAKRIYEQVQKENPTTEAAQLAAAKLQEIK